MKIINKSGKWFINTSQFRMPDPDSGTLFDPGVPTKATETEWLKGQPVIQPCKDPTADDDDDGEPVQKKPVAKK